MPLVLVALLEGPARSVLIPVSVDERPEYQTLVSVLEDSGPKNLSNLNYFLFQ